MQAVLTLSPPTLPIHWPCRSAHLRGGLRKHRHPRESLVSPNCHLANPSVVCMAMPTNIVQDRKFRRIFKVTRSRTFDLPRRTGRDQVQDLVPAKRGRSHSVSPRLLEGGERRLHATHPLAFWRRTRHPALAGGQAALDDCMKTSELLFGPRHVAIWDRKLGL